MSRKEQPGRGRHLDAHDAALAEAGERAERVVLVDVAAYEDALHDVADGARARAEIRQDASLGLIRGPAAEQPHCGRRGHELPQPADLVDATHAFHEQRLRGQVAGLFIKLRLRVELEAAGLERQQGVEGPFGAQHAADGAHDAAVAKGQSAGDGAGVVAQP